jgi:Protein of unknown function (DUF3102)
MSDVELLQKDDLAVARIGRVQAPFDYGEVTPDVAREAREAAKRITAAGRRQVEAVFAIGRELINVKDKLGHGSFGRWLATEFEMSVATANRYMQVAARVSDKFLTVRNLRITTLYALAEAEPALYDLAASGAESDTSDFTLRNMLGLLVVDQPKAKSEPTVADDPPKAKSEPTDPPQPQLDATQEQMPEEVQLCLAAEREAFGELVEILVGRLGDTLPMILDLMNRSSIFDLGTLAGALADASKQRIAFVDRIVASNVAT